MHATVRSILTAETNTKQSVTITDMEAGVEVFSRGTPRASDVLLIIAEPYFKSLETASRVKKMALDLNIPNIYVVANKVRNPNDAKIIASFCESNGLNIIGSVPQDDAFMDAAAIPVSPVDHAPNAAGVLAVRDIANKIVALHM